METKKHKIKVYSTESCIWCCKAKDFLEEHKIQFEDIDVNKNKEAATEMIKKSGQTGVPVLDIDGKIIVGFDVERIKQLLKIK